MKNLFTNLTKWAFAILAGTVLAVSPAWGQGAGIAFVNKLDQPIIIQGASFVNGMLQRSPQFVVYPEKVGFDANLSVGFRQITIYDANRPNVVLLRQTINFPGHDMVYFVRPSTNPASPYPIELFRPPPKPGLK